MKLPPCNNQITIWGENVFNIFSQVVLCEFLCKDNKRFVQEQQEIRVWSVTLNWWHIACQLFPIQLQTLLTDSILLHFYCFKGNDNTTSLHMITIPSVTVSNRCFSNVTVPLFKQIPDVRLLVFFKPQPKSITMKLYISLYSTTHDTSHNNSLNVSIRWEEGLKCAIPHEFLFF